MREFIVVTMVGFVIPVGMFFYVLFFGYPPEYWAFILFGIACLFIFGIGGGGKKK